MAYEESRQPPTRPSPALLPTLRGYRRFRRAGKSPSCGLPSRNLLDDVGGFLREHTHLILDRDPLYTTAFRNILADAGVEVVRLPPKSPNLIPYAERFVSSIRRECLDMIVHHREVA